jgi:hypothetical protein
MKNFDVIIPPKIIIRISTNNERLKPSRVISKSNPVNKNKNPKNIIKSPISRKIKRKIRFLGCVSFNFSISSLFK